jgi:diguanylate cyclase (GGDEF)-like protein/putative nucleotidyltransferase with HDIG domain
MYASAGAVTHENPKPHQHRSRRALWPAVAIALLNLGAYLTLIALGNGVPVTTLLIVGVPLALGGGICMVLVAAADREWGKRARLSRTDVLTGSLNRSGFEERLRAEVARAQRARATFGLLILDLEDFKAVNGERGQRAGDELLRWVSETIVSELRQSDAIGRWGGDEFAVLLADGDAPNVVVDRLIARLASRTHTSVGVATFPADGPEADSLCRRAEERLYANKHGEPPSHAVPQKHDLSWATELASTVDDRMNVTHIHSQAVSGLAAGAARELGWQEPALGLLRLAATLHDIGKIVVPVHILRKPGRLTDAEWGEIRKHAEAGAEIVSRVHGLEVIVPWIRHSHERMDGRGYPDQLEGEQIPLASRIILVADAYDAMTSDRPYRPALTRQEAFAELQRHAGSQFDPRCVEALITHVCTDHAGAQDASPATPKKVGQANGRV